MFLSFNKRKNRCVAVETTCVLSPGGCVSRGDVETGVEALLRSAGGSLVHLSISRCPHILTDRTLWMASCYCRNLQTLVYRWGTTNQFACFLPSTCRLTSFVHPAGAPRIRSVRRFCGLWVPVAGTSAGCRWRRHTPGETQSVRFGNN